MVDENQGSYRPRRAHGDQPAEPEASPVPPAGDPGNPGPAIEFDEDAPKPLYRDEARTPADDPKDETTVRAAGANDETQILSRARAKARSGPRGTSRRTRDEDSTTILPRTATGSRVQRPEEDLLDDDEQTPGERRRLGLLIGVVAAVVVLGLGIGYTVLSLTRESAAPGVAPSVPTDTNPTNDGSTAPPEPDPNALLTDASLLTPQMAAKIDGDRTWKVALTQKGQSAESPQPACLGGDPVEGQPIPSQSVLRVLNSTGKNPPAVLQQADAYASPEEAAQAYAVAARTLGGCTMAATYITSGATVTGLGDQSLGLVLNVADGNTSEFRTVILARTGRVLDIVDAAQPAEAVGVDKVALATADVINAQCQAAAGRCASGVQTKASPPPVGGDAPGFLATADLPPVGSPPASWVGNKPAPPESDALKGSGCERVDWAKQAATTRSWRTYLLQDSTSKFGLDEVILTQKSPADATKLADKIRADWADCTKRRLNAAVEKPARFSATGAQNTAIVGWTTTVTQKAGNTTSRFRVGIAAAGPKVIFTFLNPQDKLDLSAAQFAQVTARAGQRATQVK